MKNMLFVYLNYFYVATSSPHPSSAFAICRNTPLMYVSTYMSVIENAKSLLLALIGCF